MKTLKEQYEGKQPIGVLTFCNWGGLEVLDIIYDTDDYAIVCYNNGCGRNNIRKHKIQYTPAGRPYIRKNGTRYYFDQIMRVQ